MHLCQHVKQTKSFIHSIEVLRFSFSRFTPAGIKGKERSCLTSASVRLFFLPSLHAKSHSSASPEGNKKGNKRWLIIPGWTAPKKRPAYREQEPCVIWETEEGWRRRRSREAIGGWGRERGRRRMEGKLGEGCSSLRCEASRGAPRSPWTDACSPLTPSGEIPAALLVLSTVVCCAATQQRTHIDITQKTSLMWLAGCYFQTNSP